MIQTIDVLRDIRSHFEANGYAPIDPLAGRLRAFADQCQNMVDVCERARYRETMGYAEPGAYNARHHREAIVAARWATYLADLRLWELSDRSTWRPLPPRFLTGNVDQVPQGASARFILSCYDKEGHPRPVLHDLITACAAKPEGGDDDDV